jgi:hypothetical protein
MQNASAVQEAVNTVAASEVYRMQAQRSLVICLQELETVKSNDELRQREFVNARALTEAELHEGNDELAAYRRMVSYYQGGFEMMLSLARTISIVNQPRSLPLWRMQISGQSRNTEPTHCLSKSSLLYSASSALQRPLHAMSSVPL